MFLIRGEHLPKTMITSLVTLVLTQALSSRDHYFSLFMYFVVLYMPVVLKNVQKFRGCEHDVGVFLVKIFIYKNY